MTEKEARILLKRTNLNNVHEIADFRAAVSFLQGEPGVDPDKIGIWGSSNGGSVVIAVAAVDARVKAVVSQVATPRPAPRAPVAMGANFLKDAILRVREGQGAEVDGGFSFRSKIDQWSNQRNRDVRPGQTLDQIRPTTAVLFLPAEKDELTQGAAGAIEAAKFLSGRGVPSQAIVLPCPDALSGVFECGLRSRIEPRRGLVPEVSDAGLQGRRRSGSLAMNIPRIASPARGSRRSSRTAKSRSSARA